MISLTTISVKIASPTFVFTNEAHTDLHGINSDVKIGVIPVHLRVFSSLFVLFWSVLMGGVDAVDAQDYNDHQGSDAHYNDHCGRRGGA